MGRCCYTNAYSQGCSYKHLEFTTYRLSPKQDRASLRTMFLPTTQGPHGILQDTPEEDIQSHKQLYCSLKVTEKNSSIIQGTWRNARHKILSSKMTKTKFRPQIERWGNLNDPLSQSADLGSGLSAKHPVQGDLTEALQRQTDAGPPFYSEIMFHVHTIQHEWAWKMMTLGFAAFSKFCISQIKTSTTHKGITMDLIINNFR